MRVLIDGVYFQLASSGIARVWSSLLKEIVHDPALSLFMLDRGRMSSYFRRQPDSVSVLYNELYGDGQPTHPRVL